ncbi:MAG: hypothetical protein CME68_05225 [Halobacteriovoraceae bacterium]|nr:hypothetical protein [Halobacteriovoraceae bacterium]
MSVGHKNFHPWLNFIELVNNRIFFYFLAMALFEFVRQKKASRKEAPFKKDIFFSLESIYC